MVQIARVGKQLVWVCALETRQECDLALERAVERAYEVERAERLAHQRFDTCCTGLLVRCLSAR
jgi:hypothetical protein